MGDRQDVTTTLVGPADRELVVAGCTDFAGALYGRAASAPGNVFFAPASVSVALGMAYAGARGETAAEMARVLRLPGLEPQRLHGALGEIAARLRGDPGADPDAPLTGANALFGQKEAGFLPEFLALLDERYGAGLREVDFSGATELARQIINGWVLEQTRGKIVDLIPPGVLDLWTRLVLVNAIHFEGTWKYAFPKERTAPRPFFLLDGGSKPAPLMHRKARYKLMDIDGGQMLELPYEGGALSMVVILPSANGGLPAIEARLPAELRRWLADLDMARSREVVVYLPRFRVERALRLDGALKSLGMVRVFDENAAELEGMNGGAEALCIDAVLHKAFVDVNERGTTAAGSTGVVISACSGCVAQEPPVFRADHPFSFLIRDTRTGAVLFLGRLADPGAT